MVLNHPSTRLNWCARPALFLTTTRLTPNTTLLFRSIVLDNAFNPVNVLPVPAVALSQSGKANVIFDNVIFHQQNCGYSNSYAPLSMTAQGKHIQQGMIHQCECLLRLVVETMRHAWGLQHSALVLCCCLWTVLLSAPAWASQSSATHATSQRYRLP